MAETFLVVIDGHRDSQNLATQDIASKKYSGHYNKAVPEGGCSVYRNIDLSVTGQVVKNAPGQLYGGVIFNLAAALPSGTQDRYLKIYNKATAAVVGDTALLVMTIPLEAGVALPLDFGACGVAFSAGISVRATTGLADSDTGATNAGDVVVNLFYA